MVSSTNQKILVAGSMAFDHFYDYEGSFLDGIDTSKLVDLSVSFSVENHRMHPGGAGANIAWNLALLHQPVSLLSAIAKDGQSSLDLMSTKGIQTDSVHVHATGKTAHAIIVTDKAKRQITFFDPGIEEKVDWSHAHARTGNVALAILTPWRPSFMLPVVEWCKKNHTPFIFDPGQHILDFSREDLLKVIHASKGIVVNTYEWHLLQTRTSMNAEEILGMTPFVVITKGAEGFEILRKEKTQHFPACTHDNTFNPTGAGDAFRAGLLTGIMCDWPLEIGCQLGAGLASVVVEYEESQLPAINLADISERVAKAYDTKIPSFTEK